MLHIIRESPFHSKSFNHCIKILSAEDALLFIEEGVFCALADTDAAQLLLDITKNQKIFVLAPHAAEHGVLERLIPNIGLIDFHGFVDLVIAHTSVNWR